MPPQEEMPRPPFRLIIPAMALLEEAEIPPGYKPRKHPQPSNQLQIRFWMSSNGQPRMRRLMAQALRIRLPANNFHPAETRFRAGRQIRYHSQGENV